MTENEVSTRAVRFRHVQRDQEEAEELLRGCGREGDGSWAGPEFGWGQESEAIGHGRRAHHELVAMGLKGSRTRWRLERRRIRDLILSEKVLSTGLRGENGGVASRHPI